MRSRPRSLHHCRHHPQQPKVCEGALAPGLGTPKWPLYGPESGWGRDEPWSDLPSLDLGVSLEWGLGLPPRAAEQFKDYGYRGSRGQWVLKGTLHGSLSGGLLS